jgi:hypothetical protein
MRTEPPVKMPVRVDHQCQLLLQNGTKCHNIAWSVMTRADSTTQRLCRNHSVRIRAQIEADPGRFQKVRFSVIEK